MAAERNLYIIGGCNGAGKTTASYAVLPSILQCREFVNADEIAHGLSPFNPENVAIEAGKIMIQRINDLLARNDSFSVETTLAARSYQNLIRRAQAKDYTVTLLYFWLSSPALARRRVDERVAKGGHDIPTNVITRRYNQSLVNLFNIYIPLVDTWIIIDNSAIPHNVVATGGKGQKTKINNEQKYIEIQKGGKQRI